MAGETPDTSPSSSSETEEGEGEEKKKKKKKVAKETVIGKQKVYSTFQICTKNSTSCSDFILSLHLLRSESLCFLTLFLRS